MSKPNFVIGERYYTNDGSVVVLLAKDAGRFIVQYVMLVEDWEGEVMIEEKGKIETVEKIYVNPPKRIYCEEIKTLKEEYEKLSEEYGELLENNSKETRRARDIKDEHCRLLKKFRQLPALKHVEDFLEGRITHVVEESYSSFEIKSIDELVDRSDWGRTKGLQAIVLRGNVPSGELRWERTHYSDGSGGSCYIYPCAGLEKAKEKQKKLILNSIERKIANNDHCYIQSLVESALSLGFEVSSEAMAIYIQEKKECVERYKKRLAEEKTTVTKSEATIREIEESIAVLIAKAKGTTP